MSRMWLCVTLAFLYCVAASSAPPLSNGGAGLVSIPSEWRAKQTGTWLAWPVFNSFPESPTYKLQLEMFRYMTNSGDNKVYLIVQGEKELRTAKTTISEYNTVVRSGPGPQRINEANMVYVDIPHTDLWLRDYLLFGQTKSTPSAPPRLAVVDFDFNAWGFGGEFRTQSTSLLRVSNYFNSISNTDTQIAQKAASYLGTQTPVEVVRTWLTMEPGGLEFNDGFTSAGGRRRLILSEAVILQPERNYGKTIYEIVSELYRVFAVDEIILTPRFKFNEALGIEEVIPQCPLDQVVGGDPRWAHCFDVDSWYYTQAFDGGVVEDNSPFYGALKNEDTPTRRARLGVSDPAYDNVITSLTTGGHTDEWVRWVGENTVLLNYVPGGERQRPDSLYGRNWFRMKYMKEFFEAKGIDVVLMPVPVERIEYFGPGSCPYDSILDMKFTGGSYYDASANATLHARSPARGVRILDIFPKGGKAAFISARSYLNWIVTDKYVLVPKYSTGEFDTPVSRTRDRQAYDILRSVFAGVSRDTNIVREVVQIENVDVVNFCGGGLHCITQNMPKLM